MRQGFICEPSDPAEMQSVSRRACTAGCIIVKKDLSACQEAAASACLLAEMLHVEMIRAVDDLRVAQEMSQVSTVQGGWCSQNMLWV